MSAPSWHTGRLWLLRLGYYKLTRPKEQADDWVWIADHTVQVGAEKCLVILGMRLSALPPAGQRLSHEGVEAIALLPVEKSNKDVVYQHMNTELIAFVAHESAKARPNERLLGSSEVIESILGKLKRLEQDQAKSGFTGLLLSIGAMVSTTTSEVVQKALETVSTKKVLAWCKETLGQSVQARRREAFASHDKSEQKRAWAAT